MAPLHDRSLRASLHEFPSRKLRPQEIKFIDAPIHCHDQDSRNMSASVSPRTAVTTIEMVSYQEDEDHLVNNEPEPRSRSQTAKIHSHDHVWWIRVTFEGTIYQKTPGGCKKRKLERRQEFQGFIKSINYHSFPLLDNTVTELVLWLSSKPLNDIKVRHTALVDSNVFCDRVDYLACKIDEDPKRVVYPLCSEFPSFRRVDISNILLDKEIADGHVFQVLLYPDKDKEYIYKTMERLFYTPMDTEVLRKELENLAHVRNLRNIVQPAGVVTSRNPYRTSRWSDQSLVITGVLLEFYGGGSLQSILRERRLERYDWQKVVAQIGTALCQLHDIERAHMDIKPSNIVFDSMGNAILIDIGGMGVTHEWLAPELRGEDCPVYASFRTRLLHDSWAYGKLLLEISIHITEDPFATHLRRIAQELMQEEPESRISVADAVTQLHQADMRF